MKQKDLKNLDFLEKVIKEQIRRDIFLAKLMKESLRTYVCDECGSELVDKTEYRDGGNSEIIAYCPKCDNPNRESAEEHFDGGDDSLVEQGFLNQHT